MPRARLSAACLPPQLSTSSVSSRWYRRLSEIVEEFLVFTHGTNLLVSQETCTGDGEVAPRSPLPGIGSWIIDRDIDLKAACIEPFIAFDQVELVGVRVAHLVQPGFVVESDGIDAQR